MSIKNSLSLKGAKCRVESTKSSQYGPVLSTKKSLAEGCRVSGDLGGLGRVQAKDERLESARVRAVEHGRHDAHARHPAITGVQGLLEMKDTHRP